MRIVSPVAYLSNESPALKAKDSSPRHKPCGNRHVVSLAPEGRKIMPHTFASLLVHVIFSTKNRQPDLSPDLASRLFPYMGGIVKELKATPLIINGPADHVDLLLSIP